MSSVRCARASTTILFVQFASLFLGAASTEAQDKLPIGPFVVDVRGALARFSSDPMIASQLGVPQQRLPVLGLGIDVGAHWYPLRFRAITFGLGVRALLSRSSTAPSEEQLKVDPDEPVVRTRFDTIAPQLSFNFGGTSGWSYISGGIGGSKFSVTTGDRDRDNRMFSTINYGGGGRWFVRERLAFSWDLRFYAISPQEEMEGLPGLPRIRLMMLTIGASFK